jgi:hypothetical protein
MKTPDIEIYVKDSPFQTILNWLNQHFSEVAFPAKAAHSFENGKAVKGWLANPSSDINSRIEIMLTPKAVGKHFTSIWFKQNQTPWDDDEQCALSLLAEADIEIRCSAAGWEENEAENSEQWWLLTRGEKKKIRWDG